MLTARRARPIARAQSPTQLSATQDGPTLETTMRRARSPSASTVSEHPSSRRRYRLPTTPACCDCTRYGKCSADVRTTCECRHAGRRCYNCDPRDKCQNRLCTDPPITTGLLDPAIGLLCLPAATPPARRRRTTAPATAGTPWTFAPPTPAAGPDAQLTFLTPAQGQEADGTGNSTQTSTPALASPQAEADGTRAPAARFVFTGGAAGAEEDTQQGGQSGANDAAHGDTRSGEDAHDTEPCETIATQEPAHAAPDPGEDTEADRKLRTVYGDTIHRNDGRHLDGGIADDQIWQARYDAVVANPHQLYLPPQGKIGAEVVSLMASELRGVRERKWNSERPLILMACILRRKHGCVKANEIKKRVAMRLDLWRQGKFDALIQDITDTSLANAGYRSATNDAETAARKYNAAVLDGRLRAAVCGLVSTDGGGVLGPDDACTKTGRPDRAMLAEKHPALRTPDLSDPNNLAFADHGEVPGIIPIDCPIGDAERIARQLNGSAGCSGVDAEHLKNQLLKHGKASAELREELVEWALWLANTSPPWASYRAMRQGRLVALDKQPGIRPLGIGEAWMRAVSKLVLMQCGRDGKAACGNTQLCAGLEAGIEGAIHASIQRATTDDTLHFPEDDLPSAPENTDPPDDTTPNDTETHTPHGDTHTTTVAHPHAPEDPDVHFLSDARNGFNELSRMAMLWEVRHRWPAGSRFAYNLYRHECRLVLRGPPGTNPAILLSREGVMQGCVWGMILYGIGLMPLAERLRREDPTVLQPWYADDFALQGPASRVAKLFHILCRHGPSVGYFPEPEKCWVICPLSSEANARRVFQDASLPVSYCRGRRYVGGFVGSRATRDEWLSPMIQRWVTGIERLADVATRFPHSAYAGLVSCLSAEWQYICRTVPDVGPRLAPVEQALRTKFLPAITGISGPINDELRTLLGNGVKTGGLAIRDPTISAASLYSTSIDATSMLAGTLIRNEPINIDAHRNCVRAAGATHRKTKRDGEAAFHAALMERSPPKVKKRMERAAVAGAWLSTIPNRFSGTELTRDEWFDNVAIRYGNRPANLPDHCDGCGAGLTLEHGLSCKKGGLVGIRHDDARDEWAHLCSIALTDSRVVTEPAIFYGNGTRATATNAATNATNPSGRTNTPGDEARGDVLAHCFWSRGRGTVFDIRICDTDSRSYGATSSAKILERHAKEKKEKYEAACLERRRDFTPLVYSVDGMASKDARTAERRVAWLLAQKWKRAYSDMANFVRTRMSLAVVRSNTLLLRGDRTSPMRRRAPSDGVAASCHDQLRNE